MTNKKTKKKSNPVGRPSVFKNEYIEQVESLCLLGLTNEEMAKFFKINIDTFYDWQKNKKGFSDAIKRGKEVADINVVKTLYKKAIGAYKLTEVSYEKIIPDFNDSENIKEDIYKKRIVEKEIAPDVTAQIFWLKNRQPKMWRDKPADETSENINLAVAKLLSESLKVD